MTPNGMNPGYEIGEKTNPHTSLLGNPKQPAILTRLSNEQFIVNYHFFKANQL